MFDRHEHQKTELKQNHNGPGDNVGRDKIVNIYVNAKDYKLLEQHLTELLQERDKLIQRIRKYPDDAEFEQELITCNRKIVASRQEIEDFKADVFRLHEIFTRIPINTERLRRAREHFDKGEFREADAVLKAEEISTEVAQLKTEKKAATEKLVAIERDLEDRANEFLIKAQIALLSPAPEGSSRFERAEEWFEQALATVRTAEVLSEYGIFLYKHNAFRRAEPLFQEALKEYRSLAEANPESFLPAVAMTLNNLASLHAKQNDYDPALEEYQEALEIRRILADKNPEVFYPYLGQTLNNLAILHSQREEYDLALAKFQEALKIRCDLAETNSEEFLRDVATTLHNLATLYDQARQYDPALAGYQKALDIRRNLAETNPEAFLSDVAMTLNNLAGLHYHTKEYDPSLAEYEESLKIYRNLSETNPEAFHPDVAMTLLNLSIFYYQAVPDKAKSIAYAQEARGILVPLCKQAPHLQGELDKVEQLLQDNSIAPSP